MQNFILKHLPKQSEKKSKEGSCVGSNKAALGKPPMLAREILTGRKHFHKNLRISL